MPDEPASVFILYDGRAKGGPDSDDDATVMSVADTEAEACEEGVTLWSGEDAIWWEYDREPAENPEYPFQAVNGRPRWDIPPAKQEAKDNG